MQLHINPNATPDFSDCDPQEEALLREEVAAILVSDPAAAIQTAVGIGRAVYGQRWNEEARKLLHEFNLPVVCCAPMSFATNCQSA